MNRRVFLPALALAAVLGATGALAQSAALMADIPFEFRIGNKLLPAGEYTLAPHGSAGAILVRGSSGEQTFIMTQACGGGAPVKVGKLTFHRYGTNYYLRQIWRPGYTQGYELGRSAAEREMARNSGVEYASVHVLARK